MSIPALSGICTLVGLVAGVVLYILTRSSLTDSKKLSMLGFILLGADGLVTVIWFAIGMLTVSIS